MLASRGYGRRGRQVVEVVSGGCRVLSSAERVGDKTLLLTTNAPGVPVLAVVRTHATGAQRIALLGRVLALEFADSRVELGPEFPRVAVEAQVGQGERHRIP